MNSIGKLKNNPNYKDKMGLHKTPLEISPFYTHSKLKFNNEEKPLKQNHHDLSFKGFSKYGQVEEALKRIGKEVGPAAEKYFRELVEKAQKAGLSDFFLEGNTAAFEQKTILNRFVCTIVSPVTKMPLDIANGVLKGLKKIPGFKNSKTLDNMLANPVLTKRRAVIENAPTVAGLENVLRIYDKYGREDSVIKNDKIFKEKIMREVSKRFNLEIGNYDTATERGLARAVTGLVGASFLANDAYNLSMYMKNDKKTAKDVKRRRFKQEFIRVLLTAGGTFAAMKLFSAKANKSKNVTGLVIAGVTLISEVIGRLFVGNPVLPVDKKQAKEYAKKQGIVKDKQKENVSAPVNTSNIENPKKAKKKQKSGILTFNNILKAIGVLVGFGFAADKISNIKPVKKLLAKAKNSYESLYKKEFTITKSEFNDLMNELNGKDSDFGGLVKYYKNLVYERLATEDNLNAKEKLKLNDEFDKRFSKIRTDKIKTFQAPLDQEDIDNLERGIKKEKIEEKIKEQIIKEINNGNDGKINLGLCNDKLRFNLIHNILAFPVRFAWNAINTPYKKIVKPLAEAIAGASVKKENKAKGDAIDNLKNIILYMRKNKDDVNFKEKMNKIFVSGLDNKTKSSVSNADTGVLVKNIASVITAAFLIADNYNMVMINSQGDDKKLAEQKAKERSVQKLINIMYGAFLIKIFNSVFSTPYNASLLGAGAVCSAQKTTAEILERTTAGLPIGEATREEIIELDNKNLNATGLKGKYFKLMSKLTGKKPLSQKAVNEK